MNQAIWLSTNRFAAIARPAVVLGGGAVGLAERQLVVEQQPAAALLVAAAIIATLHTCELVITHETPAWQRSVVGAALPGLPGRAGCSEWRRGEGVQKSSVKKWLWW